MKTFLKTLLIALTFIPSIVGAQASIPAGGTGWSTSVPGDLFIGTSSLIRYTRLPIGTSGYYLQSNGTTPIWAAVSGGTPAGSTTQVQFNNNGAFAGDSEFTFSSSTDQLFVGSSGSGSELITNGTFTGSASGWSLGSNTTYSSNNILISGGINGSISQTLGATSAGWYRCSYTITNATGSPSLNTSMFLSNGAGSGSCAGNPLGNGTFTGIIFIGTAVSTSLSINTGQSGAAIISMNIDNVSLKRVAASSATGLVAAGALAQNGYTVIDSNSISSQHVALADLATLATDATTASFASAGTDPFTIGNGTGNAVIQSNAAASGYTMQVNPSYANGGFLLGVYDYANSAGPNPTFAFQADFTPFSGPLVSTLKMGDVANGWGIGGVGSFSYTTDINAFSVGTSILRANTINVDAPSDDGTLTLSPNGALGLRNYATIKMYGQNASPGGVGAGGVDIKGDQDAGDVYIHTGNDASFIQLLYGGGINLNLPTSCGASGTLWEDTGDGNTVKVC